MVGDLRAGRKALRRDAGGCDNRVVTENAQSVLMKFRAVGGKAFATTPCAVEELEKDWRIQR